MAVVQPTTGILQGWKFEPTVNLGHVFTILALLGGGISVYVGVFQTLTELVLRVKVLESSGAGSEQRRITLSQNVAQIQELQAAVANIRESNARIIEQLTGIRIDVGVLTKRSERPGEVPR